MTVLIQVAQGLALGWGIGASIASVLFLKRTEDHNLDKDGTLYVYYYKKTLFYQLSGAIGLMIGLTQFDNTSILFSGAGILIGIFVRLILQIKRLQAKREKHLKKTGPSEPFNDTNA